jgi:hypothetical protein
MYFDESPRSDDSSDESFYNQRKNINIKLKDLAITHPKHDEKKKNNQYVMSSYNELNVAVEKEKVKSLLTKGNSTMRRKPPPPPSPATPPFSEHIENIDTRIVLNRVTKNNLEPTKRRVLEKVDYSPLTSPENITFAR